MTRKILTALVAPTVPAALTASVLATAGRAAAAPAANQVVGAAAAARFTFAWPVVGEGSRGEAVVALQYQLTARRFKPDRVDGIFGPHTRAAVMRSRVSKGLSADGAVGGQTWPAANVMEGTDGGRHAARRLQPCRAVLPVPLVGATPRRRASAS